MSNGKFSLRVFVAKERGREIIVSKNRLKLYSVSVLII